MCRARRAIAATRSSGSGKNLQERAAGRRHTAGMRITPQHVTDNAAAAIEFYKRVFDPHEVDRYVDHKLGDRIVHATFRFGDSELSLSDESRDGQKAGPRALRGSPVIL